MHAWGHHLLVDLRRCSQASIRCPINITRFSQHLVDRIDMVPYGIPWVVRFGKDDKAGYTLVQLIQTSNITAHFCEESGDAYIDVFSCKTFDTRTVEDTVREFFSPEELHSRLVERGPKTPLLS